MADVITTPAAPPSRWGRTAPVAGVALALATSDKLVGSRAGFLFMTERAAA